MAGLPFGDLVLTFPIGSAATPQSRLAKGLAVVYREAK